MDIAAVADKLWVGQPFLQRQAAAALVQSVAAHDSRTTPVWQSLAFRALTDGVAGPGSTVCSHALAGLVRTTPSLASHVLREIQPAWASPMLHAGAMVHLLGVILLVQASDAKDGQDGRAMYSKTERVVHPFSALLELRPDTFADLNACVFDLLVGGFTSTSLQPIIDLMCVNCELCVVSVYGGCRLRLCVLSRCSVCRQVGHWFVTGQWRLGLFVPFLRTCCLPPMVLRSHFEQVCTLL
jgi:hypothetical protein